MEASERPEASLKRLAQKSAHHNRSQWIVDWSNGSSLVDFAQTEVVDANSMCRAGSCLQLFESVLWSANTFLVVVHPSLIGFFPTVLGLITVFTIVFHHVSPPPRPPGSTFILLVPVQLAARTSCCYPFPSCALPIQVTLWQNRLGDRPVSSILLLVILYYSRHLSGKPGHTATASSEGECIPVPLRIKAWK